jgi:hypothetical protein
MFFRRSKTGGWGDWIDVSAAGTVSDPGDGYTKKILHEYDKLTVQHTAVKTLPKIGNASYAAGTSLAGVVYSSIHRFGHDVCWNITPSTYYSAMRNPASWQYTKNFQYMNGGVGGGTAACYGSVCTTTALKVSNYKYPMVSYEIPYMLTEKRNHQICNLTIGDILWKSGHVAFVLELHYSGNTIISADIAEQDSVVHYTNVTAEKWDSYFSKNWTKLYTGDKTCGDVMPEYDDNESIVFERGNNTYVDVREDAAEHAAMNFWFGGSTTAPTTVYVKGPNATVYTAFTIADLPSSTINDVTVYDLASAFKYNDEFVLGTYLLHTDIDTTDIRVKIIDTGVISENDGVFTFSNTSQCTPVFAKTLEIFTDKHTSEKNWYGLPDGYYGFWFESKEAIGDIIGSTYKPSATPASGMYFLMVFYETDFGLTIRYSNPVGIN